MGGKTKGPERFVGCKDEGKGNEGGERGSAAGPSAVLAPTFPPSRSDGRLTALQERIRVIKERREAKEEKERYEKLATKMHAKRVERLKRREKRNKALKER